MIFFVCFRNPFHNLLTSKFRPFTCIVIASVFELNSTILFHIFLNYHAFPFSFLTFIGQKLFTWLFESYIFIFSFGNISAYLFLVDFVDFIKFVFLSKHAMQFRILSSLVCTDSYCTVPHPLNWYYLLDFNMLLYVTQYKI